MLNANNKVNYEPSIKQKEKKYSLSTVLAWLYLKTIGRILPGRWNKWAENILHHNQVIVVNGVQTEIMSKNKTTQTKYDKIEGKNFQASSEFEGKKELEDKNKELNEKLEGVSQALEAFIGLCNNQAQQIGSLQSGNDFLGEKNRELKSKLAELEKSYKELEAIAKKRGEEFLAQFKEKSEEILHLQKELIECSKEFANKTEMLSVEIEKKDGEIGSLKELNEVLEQEKKEMENKNNAQQQTIFTKDQKIKEQEDLINSFHENKDINKTVRKENENLRVQKTELENEVSQLKNESDTQIKQLENQLKQQQAELKQAEEKNAEFRKKLESTQQQLEKDKSDWEGKLNAAEKNKKELEDEINELKEQAKEKDAEVENLKQQLEKEKTNLNIIEKEKKELESEVDKLQEKSQKLEESNVEIKKQKADLEGKLKSSQGENKKLQKQVEHPSAKKTENITTFSTRNNKEIPNQSLTSKDKQTEVSRPESGQQKLNKLEGASKRREDMDKKTKEVDAISIASTTKKTLFHSMKSSFSNGSYDLFSNKKLKEFLSHKNRELKKSFPELEGKHFCHNVLGETIKSLSNQSDGKFESNKLLELLESNLKNLAREIIEAKVKGVVKKKCFDIRNVDKELRDGVLKEKLLLPIKKCMKELEWDEKVADAITDSVLNNFHSKDNSNLQEIVSEELIKGRMEFFSSNIELLQLASSIRDKFLSPDQGMCNQTQGGVNEYQLTEKAKKEYKLTLPLTPNSSMSHTTTSNIQGLAR